MVCPQAFTDAIKILDLSCHITADRSQVAKAACQVVQHLAEHLGESIKGITASILPAVLRSQASGGVSFVREAAQECLRTLAVKVPAGDILITLLDALVRSKDKYVRTPCIDGIARCLEQCLLDQSSKVPRLLEDIAAKLSQGLLSAASDGSSVVRKSAQEAYASYHALQPQAAKAVRQLVTDKQALKTLKL